jgi:hypothetical protein
MAEKDSAEIKILNLKIKLRTEIADHLDSFIRRFNTDAKNMFELIQKCRKEQHGEKVVKIEMSQENFDKFYYFMVRAKENDFISQSGGDTHGSSSYDISDCIKRNEKIKFLKDLGD